MVVGKRAVPRGGFIAGKVARFALERTAILRIRFTML
jgi:hypothetical protein